MSSLLPRPVLLGKSLHGVGPVAVAALLALLPGRASALVINDASCTQQPDNSLRFDCSVETDVAAQVSVRFCDATTAGSGCIKSRTSAVVSGTPSTSCTTGSSCYQYDLTVWNLVSGHDYEWSANAFAAFMRASYTPDDPVFTPGPLPSPDLAGVDLAVTTTSPATHDLRYLGFNFACAESSGFPPTSDSLDYFIVADAVGNIVWYQDIREQTGRDTSQLSTFHITTGDEHILLVDEQQTLVEYDLEGNVIAQLEVADGDFDDEDGVSPFLHHDLQRVGDDTFVLVGRQHDYVDVNDCDGDGSTTDTVTYVLDGIYQFDSSWELVDGGHWSLADIYSPNDCSGPQPPSCSGVVGSSLTGCDWFHGNSLYVSPTNKWLLSSKVQSRIIQVDGNTGTLDWELHGDNDSTGDGDWTVDVDASVGAAHFSNQHHARRSGPGTLTAFDNHGADDDHLARGIELALDSRARTFSVARQWEMDVDGDCRSTGSTYPLLRSDHVVVTCGPSNTIREFDGSGAQVWELVLSCSDGDARAVPYRAQPMRMQP